MNETDSKVIQNCQAVIMKYQCICADYAYIYWALNICHIRMNQKRKINFFSIVFSYLAPIVKAVENYSNTTEKTTKTQQTQQVQKETEKENDKNKSV